MTAKKKETFLQVNKDYRVYPDAYCFILEKKSIDKNGKEVYYTNDYTYHATMEQVMDKLGNNIIKNNLGDLKQAVALLKDIKKNVSQMYIKR